MTQIATVERILDDTHAEISVPRKSACGHDCEECAGCGVSGVSVYVKALNTVGARPGQKVVVESDTKKMLKIVSFVYLIPVVLFLAGYLIMLACNTSVAVQYTAAVAGAVLGFIFLIPMRFFKKPGNRLSLIVGFVFAGIGLADLAGFSSLLLCMAMGAIVANFMPDLNQIMDLCDSVTPPIFMLFFVASGADLKLSVLPTVGLVGVIYIVMRVAGKMCGAWLGGVMSKAPAKVQKFLGPALLPQAGVAIGLSLAAGRVVPDFAPQIRAVILCGTLIYELIGPAVTKLSLKKAGEIVEG